MNVTTRLMLTILFGLTLIVSVQAGQISGKLQANLDEVESDQMLSVWIQLQTANDPSVLKAAVNPNAIRAERREGG